MYGICAYTTHDYPGLVFFSIKLHVYGFFYIHNNIPPWLSVKNEHLMLALIVPGRRQVKNTDVYLQPLVDELKELWDGINV